LPLYTVPGYEEYRDVPLAGRRIAAGNNLTGNDKDPPVEPSTIRTYYEPKALNQLAVILIEMETQQRDEAFPDDLPNVR
jgi:hypothetical protein